MPTGKILRQLSLLLLLFLVIAVNVQALSLDAFDQRVKGWAESCSGEITKQFEQLLADKKLTLAQLFDTFYIPIPKTSPQKFHTQYDQITESLLQPILDKYLALDERLVFVVAVDVNGYLPTHNSRYSRPLTGVGDVDAKWNRSKRIFNDRTGLAAAHNRDPYLLQRYSRDTGEEISDMSVPLVVNDKPWGALRIGYLSK